MKNLLALVGLAVVLVVGLGWYLQWFKFGTEGGTPGHPKVTVEVETDNIKKTENKVKETVGEFIREHENGKGVPGQPTSLPGGGFTVPSELPPLPPLPTPPSPSNPNNGVLPPPPPLPEIK